MPVAAGALLDGQLDEVEVREVVIDCQQCLHGPKGDLIRGMQPSTYDATALINPGPFHRHPLVCQLRGNRLGGRW